MKFQCQVDIDLPVEQLLKVWENPDNLVHWQDGFISYEFLEGEPGAVGSTMQFRYKMGRREMVLVEIILENDLPRVFSGRYDAKPMTNTMTNSFESISSSTTRWNTEVEYTRISGFMPKLFALIMPGMFKKQVQKWLNQFKAFAESVSQEEE